MIKFATFILQKENWEPERYKGLMVDGSHPRLVWVFIFLQLQGTRKYSFERCEQVSNVQWGLEGIISQSIP